MANLWSRFFGSAGSQAVGVGLGTTAVPALIPAAQYLINQAWDLYPDHPLIAAQLAVGVATGELTEANAVKEARLTGINEDRFKMLVKVADTGPGVARAFDLWRRDELTDARFKAALKKEGMEDGWANDVVKLKWERLTPAQIALGIVRSILDDKGLLVTDLDTGPGKVPRYPVSDIDVLKEAAAQGITEERLRVMVGEIGLPMSPQQAASALFRGLITQTDYNAAIAEGDIRPEWAAKILEQAAQIPSVTDYVQAHLKGWIDAPAMYAGTAKHGMSKADTDLIYLRSGRPAAPGQMATAAARGIDGPDKSPMDKAQFLKGIKESDIRPEWGEMLWDSRFLYPPLFQLTRLVQADAITPEVAREWAIKDRYPPEVVNALFKYWNQPTAGKADTHVAKAETQLWNTLHRSYLAGDTTVDDAKLTLTTLNVPVASQATVIALWDDEARLIRARLTAAQLKKAWAKGVKNPLTNLPWTRDEVLAELMDRGWNPQDANTFLDT